MTDIPVLRRPLPCPHDKLTKSPIGNFLTCTTCGIIKGEDGRWRLHHDPSGTILRIHDPFDGSPWANRIERIDYDPQHRPPPSTNPGSSTEPVDDGTPTNLDD